MNTLFVDKKHQRTGIATALINRIENSYKSTKKSITIRSSTCAIGFYEKIGYKKTRGLVRNKNGWTYQPMKKTFQPHL